MATISYGHIQTPVGTLRLTGRDGTLAGLHFMDEDATSEVGNAWVRDESAFEPVRRQLEEYFTGRRREFDLPLQIGGSPFQLKVWEALRGIPYGLTASYGEIARQIGSPGAARAVGAANGRNPIAIIVPCHRVIGADDTLTGYGGGLDRKAWLLDLERGFKYEGGDLVKRPACLRARAVLRPSPVL